MVESTVYRTMWLIYFPVMSLLDGIPYYGRHMVLSLLYISMIEDFSLVGIHF